MLDDAPTDVVGYPRSLFATFTLALDHAVKKRPEAGVMVSIGAFLDAADILLDLFPDEHIGKIASKKSFAAH